MRATEMPPGDIHGLGGGSGTPSTVSPTPRTVPYIDLSATQAPVAGPSNTTRVASSAVTPTAPPPKKRKTESRVVVKKEPRSRK